MCKLISSTNYLQHQQLHPKVASSERFSELTTLGCPVHLFITEIRYCSKVLLLQQACLSCLVMLPVLRATYGSFGQRPPCFKKKRHNNSCVNLFPVLIIYNTSSYTPKWQVQRGSLNLPLWGVPSICSLLKYGTVQKYSYSSRHVCLVLSCCRCAHADKVLLVPASGEAPSTLA